VCECGWRPVLLGAARSALAHRLHAFLGQRVILRTLYRYYWDDWGVQAHTLQVELPIKLTLQWSVSPYLRGHTQTAARYYAPFAQHPVDARLRTSDADLSALQSLMGGYRPLDGILGFSQWNLLELRVAGYRQTRNLRAGIVSLRTGFAL
jgi:hypothetical protein